METKEHLLSKYYNAGTTLEEEKELRSSMTGEDNLSSERDIFKYFEDKNHIPENLEDDLFNTIQKKESRKKTIRRRIYSFTTAAAAIVIILSVYLNLNNTQNAKMESDFLVMDQALFQISESIQPDRQEDMLVLWVDDNVEIIIN